MQDELAKVSNTRNLSKIFDQCDEDLSRRKIYSNYKAHTTLLRTQLHRGKITSILVADNIYTASLDYSVKRIFEHDGRFIDQIAQ